MSGRLLTIYTARSRKASLWSRTEYTWQELCDRLMSFAVHHSWCNVPRRCQKLFKKALTFPDGSKLMIVADDPE